MNKTNISDFTLLLVEDNQINRQLYVQMLKPSGIKILEACDGDEAIACVKENKIDIILMDAMMPNKDGFEATQEIKEMDKSIPIIILTAFVNQESIKRAVSCGSNDYLAKPIQREVLVCALEKWLIKPIV